MNVTDGSFNGVVANGVFVYTVTGDTITDTAGRVDVIAEGIGVSRGHVVCVVISNPICVVDRHSRRNSSILDRGSLFCRNKITIIDMIL